MSVNFNTTGNDELIDTTNTTLAGALDLLIHQLLTETYAGKPYFDLGSSMKGVSSPPIRSSMCLAA